MTVVLRPTSLMDWDRAACFWRIGPTDSDAIRSSVIARGAWANIPPKRNRKQPICFSPCLYRDRNQIERFFNRIKHCRRIATRYEKPATNYLAFVKLASIRLWLRVNESTS